MSLSNSGSNAVTITDSNALTLGTVSVGQNFTANSSGALSFGSTTVPGTLVANSNGGSISQSAALAITGTSSFTAGAATIDLTTNGSSNNFVGAVSLSNSGSNAVTITDTNALTLGTVSVGQNFTANSTGALSFGSTTVPGNLVASSNGGAISQSAALAITGTSSFTAGTATIDLTTNGSSNDFTGAVSLSNSGSNAVTITDSNALTLGTVSVGQNFTANSTGALSFGSTTVPGILTAASNGSAISQTGTISVTGASSFTAGSAGINLTTNGASNSFTGAISLSNSGANNVSLTNNHATVIAASNVGSGTLTIASNGTITETGAIVQAASAGAVTINQNGTGADILLDTQANNFSGGVSFGGSGSVRDLGLRNINSSATLPTLPSSLRNLTLIFDNSSITIPAVTITGDMSVTAGGTIAQSGAISIGGSSTATFGVSAANSDILLASFANDFGTSILFSNTSPAALTNIRDVSVRNTNSGASIPSLSGITNLRNLTLIFDNASIALPAVTLSGNLSLVAGGNITQSGAITATSGTATLGVSVASSDILLASFANDIGGSITFSNTSPAALTNIHDIALRNTNSSASIPSLSGITNLHNLTIQFDNAAIVIPAVTLTGGGSLSVTAGGAISQSGAIVVPGTASFTAGSNAINLTTNGASNSFTGAVSLSNSGTNDVSLTDSIALSLGTSTIGRNLTLVAGGAGISQVGAITATGGTAATSIKVTASGADVLLNTQANNFGTTAITFAGTLGNFRDIGLRNTNSGAVLPTNLSSLTNLRNLTIVFNTAPITFPGSALSLSGNLSATAGGAISQGAALSVGGTSSISTGAFAIDLTTNGASNDFTGAVSLSNSGSNAVTITDTNALTLGTVSVGQNFTANSTGALSFGSTTVPGALTANSNGGAISQSAAISVTGTSSFTAGAAGINLTSNGASNSFTGAVSLSNSGTNDVSLTNSIATVLGASSIGRNITLVTGGSITQNGAITATGGTAATSITATNANTDVALDTQANNFGTTAITFAGTLGNFRDIGLRNTNAGAVLPTNLTSLTNLRNLTIVFNNAPITFPGSTLTLTNSGNLSATAGGAISQSISSVIIVPGTSSFSTGSFAIDLTTNGSSNDFTGAVSLSNSGSNAVTITDTNALTLGTVSVGQNFTANSTGALSFGSTTVPGNLVANSNNGAISQSAALAITGTSSFTAGSATIDLTTNGSSNNFVGAVSLSNSGSNAVTITDTNALTLGTVSVGQNFTANSTGALSFGSTTVPGNLVANSHGSAISQSAALAITGTSSFIAGAATIDLTTNGSSNNFVGAVSLSNSGSNAVTITDTNALTLGTVSVGQNFTANSTGALSFGATTVPGSLVAASNGGAISQSAAISVTGTSSFTAGGAGINLTSNGASNDFGGAVSLSNSGTNDVSITDVNALVLGTSSIGRNLTIVVGGALTQNGAITATGGTAATSITASNANTDISLDTQANNFGTTAITFAGTLGNFRDIGLRNTNAGAVLPTNLTSLTNLRNLTIVFNNAPITFPGATLTLTGGGNLSATAGGAISQSTSSVIIVPGTSSFSTGSFAIDLTTNGASNSFTGAITLNNSGANNVSITNNRATVIAAANVGSGTLTIASNGAISETGAIVQAASAGAVSINQNATSADILLDTQANNFSGGVSFGGSGTVRDLGVRNINSSATLPTLPSTLRNLTLIFDNSSITIPAVSVSGNIAVTTGGSISQSGVIDIGNSSTATFGVTAASSDILLGSFANDFGTSILFSNTSPASLTNIRDINVRNTNASASIPNLSGITNLRNLTLVFDNASINIPAVSVSGSIALTSGGSITQSGIISAVNGSITAGLSATSSDVLLGSYANDIGGSITFSNTAPASLSNIRDVNFRNVSSSASLPSLSGITNLRNLTMQFDNTAITIPALTLISSGNLNITAGGAITQSGVMSIPGTSSFNANANPITLNNSSNNFVGAISLTTTGSNNAAITNNAAMIFGTSNVGGTLTATSAGTITQTGNISASGLTATSVGGLTLSSSNAINNFNITNNTSGNVTLTNTSDSFNVTGITQNGGNVNLTNTGTFTVSGLISTNGGSVDLTASTSDSTARSINMQSNISTSGGAINFNSKVAVNGSVTVNAGNGAIQFANTVSGAGNTLTLQNSTTANGGVTFNDNITLGSLVTFAQPYQVIMKGASNTISSATTFNNTNGVSITNAGTFDFNGGLTSTASTTTLNATVNTSNTNLTLGVVTLSGNSTLSSSGGTITLGAVSGGSNSLTLNAGSSGNITMNGNETLGSMTINNVNTFTNNATVTVTSFQQNAGNTDNLGTSTLIVNNGNANVTATNINGNLVVNNGNATYTATNVNGSMTVTGMATINSTNLTGTVNVGGLTLNVTGSVSLTNSTIAGLTGAAAIAKIVFIVPPSNGQFFDGLPLTTGQSSTPSTVSNARNTAVNAQNIFADSTESLFAASASAAAIQVANSLTPATVPAGVSVAGARSAANALSTLPETTMMRFNPFASELSAIGLGPSESTALQFPRFASLARGLAILPEALPAGVATLAGGFSAAIMVLLAMLAGMYNALREAWSRRNYLDMDYLTQLSFNMRSELNTIFGFAGMLQSEKLCPVNPAQKEYLTDIVESSNSISDYLAKNIEGSARLPINSLATVSFNLRTMLSGTLGFAELMNAGKTGNVSPEFKEYIGYIVASSNEILRLTNAISAKPDTNRWVAFYEDVKAIFVKPDAAKLSYIKELSFRVHTSLSDIIGFTQLISEEKIGKINDEQKEYLSDVLSCSNDMKQLINGIETDKLLSNKTLNDFTFRMRTLLDSIIGFAEIIKFNKIGPIPGEIQEYLDYVITSANNIMHQVYDLSDRIQSKAWQKVLHSTHELFVSSKELEPSYINEILFNIRTCLNNIIGFSGLLSDEKVGSITNEQKEYINDITQGANDLHNYLQNDVKANISIDELIDLSFKVRTALASIVGFAQLIHDEKVGSISNESKEYLGYMISSTNDILTLIESIAQAIEAEKDTVIPLIKMY